MRGGGAGLAPLRRAGLRGKRPEEFVTTLALRCTQAVRAGRRLAGSDRSRDVLSPVARVRHGVVVVRLDDRVPAPWLDPAWAGAEVVAAALAIDPKARVAEQAAFRIDFPAWRARLSVRDRAVADALAAGEGTGDGGGAVRPEPGAGQPTARGVPGELVRVPQRTCDPDVRRGTLTARNRRTFNDRQRDHDSEARTSRSRLPDSEPRSGEPDHVRDRDRSRAQRPGARKQLSDQLDRLDAIIDVLAEGLPEAVAQACREGARQAVKDAVVEILTNPELRALFAALNKGAAPAPTRAPGLWSRLKAKVARAKEAVTGALARAKEALTARLRTAHDRGLGAERADRRAVALEAGAVRRCRGRGGGRGDVPGRAPRGRRDRRRPRSGRDQRRRPDRTLAQTGRPTTRTDLK